VLDDDTKTDRVKGKEEGIVDRFVCSRSWSARLATLSSTVAPHGTEGGGGEMEACHETRGELSIIILCEMVGRCPSVPKCVDARTEVGTS
jgi:hypothetical protein